MYGADQQRQQVVSAKPAPDRSAAPSGSVLIIDDAPIHGAVIRRIAGKVGFIVTNVQSYDAACDLLRRQTFDCITLDLGLGDHVGGDVLNYLSGIRCRSQIVVISQSDKETCDDIVELARVADLNVYNAVQKPIDLEVLRRTLAEIRALLGSNAGRNDAEA